MPPAGFNPQSQQASDRKIYALDRAATGIGDLNSMYTKCKHKSSKHIVL